jgi:hypothetical protein
MHAGWETGVLGDPLQQQDKLELAGFVETGQQFGIMLIGSALGLGE